MYLMIDNYDSFVYNLAAYFREAGAEMQVVRNDRITVSDVKNLKDLEGIVLSPGPKTPEEGGRSLEILQHFQGKVPILGVCLGHQMIGHHYRASVQRGERPMHGKISRIRHENRALFSGLPETFSVTRYHSLVVSEQTFPACLQIDARSEDGAIMALSHREYPIYGVQFHLEAVMTEYGHELIENFMRICVVKKKARSGRV